MIKNINWQLINQIGGILLCKSIQNTGGSTNGMIQTNHIWTKRLQITLGLSHSSTTRPKQIIIPVCIILKENNAIL